MSENLVTQQSQPLTEFNVPKGMVNLQEISLMLIEQMKDIKNNPAAIPQAECAVMVAGRIVDIAKTQVAQISAVTELMRARNI